MRNKSLAAVRRWWPLAAWTGLALGWAVWCSVDALAGILWPGVAMLAIPAVFACGPNGVSGESRQ